MLKLGDLSVLLNWKQMYLCSYSKQVFNNTYITESVEMLLTISTFNKFNFIIA